MRTNTSLCVTLLTVAAALLGSARTSQAQNQQNPAVQQQWLQQILQQMRDQQDQGRQTPRNAATLSADSEPAGTVPPDAADAGPTPPNAATVAAVPEPTGPVTPNVADPGPVPPDATTSVPAADHHPSAANLSSANHHPSAADLSTADQQHSAGADLSAANQHPSTADLPAPDDDPSLDRWRPYDAFATAAKLETRLKGPRDEPGNRSRHPDSGCHQRGIEGRRGNRRLPHHHRNPPVGTLALRRRRPDRLGRHPLAAAGILRGRLDLVRIRHRGLDGCGFGSGIKECSTTPKREGGQALRPTDSTRRPLASRLPRKRPIGSLGRKIANGPLGQRVASTAALKPPMIAIHLPKLP